MTISPFMTKVLALAFVLSLAALALNGFLLVRWIHLGRAGGVAVAALGVFIGLFSLWINVQTYRGAIIPWLER